MGVFGPDWWDFNAAQNGVFRGPQHMIFTVNGAAGDMFFGYQADMARDLCNQFPHFAWQPIGYDSKPAPMKAGIDQGVAEHVRQLTEVHPTGTWIGIYYSEGAIIGSNVLDLLRDPTSPIAHRLQDCIAVVALGNPRREAGNVAPGCMDPGGFGIVEPNTVDTPSWWWNFANGKNVPGSGGDDLYTTCSGATGAELKDMRAIWGFVYNVWNGVGSLTKQILKLFIEPWQTVAAVKAITAAAKFFGTEQLRPHTDYQVSYPIPGDPRDCWAIGFDYLAEVGAQIPARG